MHPVNDEEGNELTSECDDPRYGKGEIQTSWCGVRLENRKVPNDTKRTYSDDRYSHWHGGRSHSAECARGNVHDSAKEVGQADARQTDQSMGESGGIRG